MKITKTKQIKELELAPILMKSEKIRMAYDLAEYLKYHYDMDEVGGLEILDFLACLGYKLEIDTNNEMSNLYFGHLLKVKGYDLNNN